MAYEANVIADSVSEAGCRLTTLEITFPRLVLAEFNTHSLSRNSASSRAIPVQKQLEKIEKDPFIPIYWGANKKGMQADDELDPAQQEIAKQEWLAARDDAVRHVQKLMDIGLHKQITNRILEPWMWQTVLVTASGDMWPHFLALRTHKDAQPEIQRIAIMMRDLLESSEPDLVREGEWHMPLIGYVPPVEKFESIEAWTARREQAAIELEWAAENPGEAIKVSAGRCARVSYLTHDGERDFQADIDLYSGLVSRGHMSPLEHVATPFHREDKAAIHLLEPLPSGKLLGWKPLRKTMRNEGRYDLVLAEQAANA